MENEEIIVELTRELFEQKKSFATLQKQSENYRKWWIEDQEKAAAFEKELIGLKTIAIITKTPIEKK